MTDQPAVPRSREEVAAAKIYLRELFTHAVDNFDRYVQSTDYAEGREMAIASRHITEEEYDSQITEGRKAIEKGVAEVAAGTAEGEKLLDRLIEGWQMTGGFPDFLASK